LVAQINLERERLASAFKIYGGGNKRRAGSPRPPERFHCAFH
jgi:hypothetical protein